mgnify:CR=1 FL=1
MIKLKKFSLTIATFLFAVGMISPLSSNNSVVSADIIANPVISRNCPAYSNHDQEIKYANEYSSCWNILMEILDEVNLVFGNQKGKYKAIVNEIFETFIS